VPGAYSDPAELGVKLVNGRPIGGCHAALCRTSARALRTFLLLHSSNSCWGARHDTLAIVDSRNTNVRVSTKPGELQFRQGELGRMILGALRYAEDELSTAQIVTALLVAGGHGEGARRAMAPRGTSPIWNGGAR
jgi:hypothetical protein